MSDEAKQYRIESLADFVLVPEDRMAACLEEFADWCEICRRTDTLLRTLAPDHPADKPIVKSEAFVWIDDGKRNVTMHLAGEESPDLVRVHWPDDGGPITVDINKPKP